MLYLFVLLSGPILYEPSTIEKSCVGNTVYTTGGLVPDVFLPPTGIQTPFVRKEMTFGSIDNPPACNCPTKKKHWDPSPTLIGLPYAFARHNTQDRHYMGQVFRVNTIIAHELGYATWKDYAKTRGWLCKKVGTRYEIKFKRVKDCKAHPTMQMHVRNLHALLVKLYSRIKDPKLKNKYGGTLPLNCMEPPSFVAKINTFCQDCLKALVLTTRCFLPYVPDHHGDAIYWTEIIFKDCFSRNKMLMFQSDLVLLLNDDKKGEIAKDLIRNHQSSILTVVTMRVANMRFKTDMRNLIHQQLQFAFGKQNRTFTPGVSRFKDTNWSVVKNRIMDSAIPLLESMNPEKGSIPTVTREKKRKHVSEYLAESFKSKSIKSCCK